MPQQKQTLNVKLARTVRLNYLLFLPSAYGAVSQQKWPLILFLHGAGERGSDLELLKLHGMPKVVEGWPDCPFIVASPQSPIDKIWLYQLDALDLLLDDLLSRYVIDPARIYLTGLSLGGYGTWHLATLHPERFAAIAPVCGGGNRGLAYLLKDVPVWAFHGAQDDIVPLAESTRMVEALKACGANVRFTIYPDAKHDSWTETYNNPELYEWFLSHKKADT